MQLDENMVQKSDTSMFRNWHGSNSQTSKSTKLQEKILESSWNYWSFWYNLCEV